MEYNIIELVKAIRNRCDIFLLLCDNDIAAHLFPALLEDLYQDAQDIIDEYCTEKND